MFVSFLISLAINVLIGEIQGRRTKLNDAKAEAINSPTATEDRSLPYGVGIFRVAGNVVWTGDELAKAVKESVKTSLFSSKSVAVGYEYHAGLWMTLAGAPCDRVLEVRYGDEAAWTGEHQLGEGMSELVFSKRTKEEGEKVDRGIGGTLRFFNSKTGAAAARNAYVETQVGEEVPRYPGVLHAVWVGPAEGASTTSLLGMSFKKFQNGFFGSSPAVQPLLLTLQRMPDLSDALPSAMQLTWPVAGSLHDAPVRVALGEWLAGVESIQGDANPALALLELLTSRIPGLGPCLNPWCIDTESFLRAAQTLHAEGVGISASWDSSQQLAQIIESICTVAQAVPLLDPATGRVSLRLIRNSDQPAYSFNSDNVLRLHSFERKAPEQLPNIIELAFHDRENSWAERVAQAKNPAGVKTAGTTLTETISVIGVTRAELALKLANRELRARCAPLANVSFDAVVEPGTVLQVGELIELYHEPLDQHLRLRITSARYGSLADASTVAIDALEDVFRPGFSGGVVSPLPAPVQPSTPPSTASAGGLMLAPYALTGEEADLPLFYSLPGGDEVKAYRVSTQPSPTWVAGYPPTYSDDSAMPAIAGALTATLGPLALGGLTIALDDANVAAAQALPAGALALIGQELLYVEALVLDEGGRQLHMTVTARGVYDTSPAPAAAGAQVVVLTDYVVYPEALKTDSAGGTPALVMRAEVDGVPVAETEKAYEHAANSSPARASKPLPPAGVYLAMGLQPAFSPEAAALVIERVTAVTVGWRYRNRALRTVTNYLSEVDQLWGGRVGVRVGWLLDDGRWAEDDAVHSAVDAQTLTVSTKSAPVGPRLGRLTVWSETSAKSVSRAHTVYFLFS